MSFAALVLRARAANDTTRAQINNIPSKSHVIPLIINLSLQSGVFPVQWECALVSPLLKKLGLELLLKNYRPVSNLQYISKLTEKAVFQQMHSHMTINYILSSSHRTANTIARKQPC